MEHAMRHFNKVLTTLFLAGFLLFLPFTLIAQAAKHARSFEFTYEAVLKNIPSTAHTVRIWIPIASSNPHQAVKIIQKVVPVPARITRDPVFGNRMLYAVMKHPHSSTARFRIVYAVTRYEYSRGDYRNLMAYNRDPAKVPVRLVRYVQPDRLVPTGGVIAQIASETTQGKEGQIEKAFALYNYVFHNMRYDKSEQAGVGVTPFGPVMPNTVTVLTSIHFLWPWPALKTFRHDLTSAFRCHRQLRGPSPATIAGLNFMCRD